MLSCKKFTTETIDWINVAISKESDKIIGLTRWMVAACLKCKNFLNIDGETGQTMSIMAHTTPKFENQVLWVEWKSIILP